ncbi:hypothetical protein Pth03_77180 [Planotetraspora thailandica]|uniref:Leucine-binding protein domain-containing protein n=1 Tax=Planotetraspora thailandica TaxID=487172 RepID=A0A8J3Y234_9ACTN|nr:hypothetical protein [Planotetraspora thailandica]GII59329.1 hypothetical protein Pth03_77180 [Planotetraspora thailandica]
MTISSPLSPRHNPVDVGPTDAELERMTGMCGDRGALTIILGHGRTPDVILAATRFTQRWEEAGGVVLDTITWPESAASWMRQALRFTASEPDLWVMLGPVIGWARMTRRLLSSTPWQPSRTIAAAAVGTADAIGLVGAADLSGMAGATCDGGMWTISCGELVFAPVPETSTLVTPPPGPPGHPPTPQWAARE